jgi:hypothetical protein
VDVVARLRSALADLPQVRLAILFGSTARGSASRSSDLDVGLIVTGSVVDRDVAHRALRRAAGDALDLVDLTTAPPLLRFEIARDGVVLAEAETGAWADFKAHAMIDWWDFAPTARMIAAAAAARLRRADTHGPA